MNLKKISKCILTTGGFTLVSLGIFAGCGDSDCGENKASIKQTLNNLFNKGIQIGDYNGSAEGNSNFNVSSDDKNAIDKLVKTGAKTNADDTKVNLTVTSVISDSIIINNDGSKVIEATVVINDADIPNATKKSFVTTNFTNLANNFIYTIAYIIDKNNNVISFTKVVNSYTNQLEFFGDGLTRYDNNGNIIVFNPKWVKGNHPFNGQKQDNQNIKAVPLFDNRISLLSNDNGPDYLLSLGNAFYLTAKDTGSPVDVFDDVLNSPISDMPSSTFDFKIGYSKDLSASVNKLGNGYNWSIKSSQLSFAQFDLNYKTEEHTTLYVPIVFNGDFKKPVPEKQKKELIKHLAFYGTVDFQYSTTGSNHYVGYKVSDLHLFS
ncbi:hypothetical protein [Mycoplasma sp. SG1]|uniref:hypothetical protein n=1 Tax=Mycoplasma sp. SG1 TaxID=2810348 RepID=UPI0020256C98|nr:hypothetical protein [Mycoplasma sp. SG1]URM53026.1 hypothetical protein JRW51_01625 [Mycoplasma sp. SG1]